MTDIKTPEARSKNMASIHGKDTKPEVYFRKLLFAKGYRYRKNCTYICGHPDIYLPKFRTAIFVHGCFWHRHKGCKFAYTPKSRIEFWQNKFKQNQRRDIYVKEKLREDGVKQIVLWECTINKMKRDECWEGEVLNVVESFFNNSIQYLEL